MVVLIICSAEYIAVCLDKYLTTLYAKDQAASGANVREWWKIVACGMLRKDLMLCVEDEFQNKGALDYEIQVGMDQ